MAKKPDDLVLPILIELRTEIKAGFTGVKSELGRLDATISEVRRHVASLDMRMEALDEKFELIREGTVSAIGFAANASRGHVDLQKQIKDLPRRVEKLEEAK
jgi:archaellum component FlaC